MFNFFKKHKFFFLLMIKIIIFVGISGYIYSTIHTKDLSCVVQRIAITDLFIATFFIISGIFMIAIRWRFAIEITLNKKISLLESFQQNYKTYALGQVLPGYVSGDIYRTYALTQYTSLLHALIIIFLDRFFALFVSIIVAICVAPFFMDSLFQTPIGKMLLMFFSFFCIGILAMLSLKTTCIRFIPKTEIFYTYLFTFFHKKNISKAFFFYTLVDLIFILPIFFIAQKMGLCLGFSTCCLVMPLVFIAGALPISFAGWGIREGVFVSFMVIFGLSQTEAFVLSVSYGIVSLLAALPALIFIFVHKTKNVSRA